MRTSLIILLFLAGQGMAEDLAVEDFHSLSISTQIYGKISESNITLVQILRLRNLITIDKEGKGDCTANIEIDYTANFFKSKFISNILGDGRTNFGCIIDINENEWNAQSFSMSSDTREFSYDLKISGYYKNIGSSIEPFLGAFAIFKINENTHFLNHAYPLDLESNYAKKYGILENKIDKTLHVPCVLTLSIGNADLGIIDFKTASTCKGDASP